MASAELAELHQALVTNGLVVWTGGNVSARIRVENAPDIFVIKPSGVAYENLDAAAMVGGEAFRQPGGVLAAVAGAVEGIAGEGVLEGVQRHESSFSPQSSDRKSSMDS